MAGSSFGTIFRLTTWGESHGKGVGVVVDGVPAGLSLSEEDIQVYLDRRKPGQNRFTTKRKESDTVQILSGTFEGKTTGTPISMVVWNEDQHSKDYSDIASYYRPGHADYTFDAKYGFRDYRGGGRSSGRETAMRVAAGSVAKQLLAHYGVTIQAYTLRLGGVDAAKVDLAAVESNIVRSADPDAAEAMIAAIRAAQAEMDSVGGIIECAVFGAPAGLGDPMFGGMENRIAAAVFGIPAVKGVEFGAGFGVASLRGSEDNDAFTVENGKIITETNHCGGILGGITNGMPIVFRAAFKPTPSIAREQQSVNLQTMTPEKMAVTGRHDPCIVPRAVPCVEAAAAIAVYDAYLSRKKEVR